MATYSLISLGLLALLSIPASAVAAPKGSGECTAVAYSTFEEFRVPGVWPTIGVDGIYANHKNGDCIYVDAAADGEFAKNHVASTLR